MPRTPNVSKIAEQVRRYALNEEAGFQKAMEANPNDATSRLVYADWLEEHGNPEAAHRIRWWAGAKQHLDRMRGRTNPGTDTISGNRAGGTNAQKASASLPEWANRLLAVENHRRASDDDPSNKEYHATTSPPVERANHFAELMGYGLAGRRGAAHAASLQDQMNNGALPEDTEYTNHQRDFEQAINRLHPTNGTHALDWQTQSLHMLHHLADYARKNPPPVGQTASAPAGDYQPTAPAVRQPPKPVSLNDIMRPRPPKPKLARVAEQARRYAFNPNHGQWEEPPAPTYQPYAWPGGYPLVHWHEGSGSAFCADCANAFAANNPDEPPLHSEPHYEGPPIQCDDCGTQIDSSYGDPDAPDDTDPPVTPSPDDIAAAHEALTRTPPTGAEPEVPPGEIRPKFARIAKAVRRYAANPLPPMAVTVYGRPQGVAGGTGHVALTVHHPNGGRAVHQVSLWGHGDQLAHNFAMGEAGDQTARGILADWIDENSENFQAIPPEYRPYVGQLLRRGHRYPPEPPEPIGHESQGEPPPAHLSRVTAQVRKYAAWRAPAGGMIARGNYYVGGEMVPDMQGAYMNPPAAKPETKPYQLDAKKVAKVRANFKPKKVKHITVQPGTEGGSGGGMIACARAVKRYASYRDPRRVPPTPPPEPPHEPEPLPPFGDDDRRLRVLNHEPLYRRWQATIGPEVDLNQADPLEDGFIDQHRDEIDHEIRQQPGMGDYPNRMSRLASQVKRYAESSTDLAALLRRARSDPYDPTLHGAIADALEEHMPGNAISELIRKQYGQGQYGGQGEQNNLWHDAFYAGYDNTHPYAARLGRHGPFDLYLLHEGNENQNPRWILRAASRLPGSRDVAYNFEIDHSDAHAIPKAFPAASEYINPQDYNFIGGYLAQGARDNEASAFDDRMDAEERARE